VTGPRRSREPKHPLDCHERALRLLAVRPRSRRELQTRLLQAGFEAQEVADELARLDAVGLVNDAGFARAVAEHQLTARRAGRRAVASALAAKGVDRGTIDATLEEFGGSDAERAEELARARAPRLSGLPFDKAYARLVSFLIRRGHDPETARVASRRALGVGAGED
jgi:regulatory protein